ncbi:MAG: hypothetical protein GIX02_07320 [Candidatus Eremiobacteraeota bacterium]|nr:hypothetical protein [Candidatus Eremiobacteraeota bacterium]
MKKLALCSFAVIFGASMLAQGASASGIVGHNQWQPMYTVLPAHDVDYRVIDLQASASQTIPFFRSSVKSPLDDQTYPFEMVGTNPLTTRVSTTVRYVPLLLRIHFPDGTVLDPSKAGCNDYEPVERHFFGSPLFESTDLRSNGVYVGHTQFEDAFQRASFWKYVAGTNFHVLLAATSKARLVDVAAPSGSQTFGGICAGTQHNMGLIDINAYDNLVTQLANKYAKPNELPIVASYNVVELSGPNCCIIGYHSAYGRAGGTQTYAVGAYTDRGLFQAAAISDIHAWSHELGEWMDDPFVDNATPAYGHAGQVGGCQIGLEVGDPLTGTPSRVKFEGFTYHPQELAFFSWFYRIPSTGTGGEYSYQGTFESAQPACH